MKRVQDQSKVKRFKSIIIEEEIRNEVEEINDKKKRCRKVSIPLCHSTTYHSAQT